MYSVHVLLLSEPHPPPNPFRELITIEEGGGQLHRLEWYMYM